MISSDIVVYLQVVCKQKAMDTEDQYIGLGFIGTFGLTLLAMCGYVVYKTKCERISAEPYETLYASLPALEPTTSSHTV
jgi:hypothetical protein